jgi:hypothetical protein
MQQQLGHMCCKDRSLLSALHQTCAHVSQLVPLWNLAEDAHPPSQDVAPRLLVVFPAGHAWQTAPVVVAAPVVK